jgi:hypothetical protein
VRSLLVFATVVLAVALALRLRLRGAAGLAADLDTSWTWLERGAPWVAYAIVCASIGVAWRWGTFAVGGSDSHCYVSQAYLFAEGRTFAPAPIPLMVPWPAVEWTFAPAGHVPAAGNPGASVPMCPAGLSLAMALLLRLAGPTAVFAAVPLLAGLAVWLAYRIGRQIHGPIAGLMAAALLASSPIFLYQAVQPMSDVPAAAWWLATLVFAIDVLHRPPIPRPATPLLVGAGLAASMALLTRPNLVPLAGVIGVFLAIGERDRLKRLFWFAIGLAPGLAAIGWLNQTMYGSPLRSGYGDLGNLFAASNVLPNLQRYASWLASTHTPLLVLALCAPAAMTKGRRVRPLLLCGGVALATLACYLPYAVFEDWWYLRFLLPGLAPLIVVLAVIAVSAIDRLPRAARTLVTLAILVGFGAWSVRIAVTHHAFRLWRLERHFIDAGRYVAARLPARAVVFAAHESGSVRFYSGRPTLVWDQFDPAWLDRAFGFLEERGYVPYLLIESLEEERFKSQFRSRSAFATLDWPPVVQIGVSAKIYNPVDRARYLAGERVATERLPLSTR